MREFFGLLTTSRLVEITSANTKTNFAVDYRHAPTLSADADDTLPLFLGLNTTSTGDGALRAGFERHGAWESLVHANVLAYFLTVLCSFLFDPNRKIKERAIGAIFDTGYV